MNNVNKILVVGKNSFIGQNFSNQSSNIDLISHKEISTTDFSSYGTVFNCSISPDFRTKKYEEQNNIDFIVAKKSHENACHFVMLSTRKVYGQSDDLITYTETSEIKPIDNYAENKYITENKIRNNFDNYTILRASNVFGNEHGRNSFLGFCLTQLKENDKIVFELSEQIKRDFILVDEVSRVLKIICDSRKTGTYNLSSNYALEIGNVAKNLIEGYGSGSFEYGDKITDQFMLDNNKLQSEFQIEIKKNYTNELKMIGENLCKI
jgi:nucleoside-diphosphate-sugar epimerase